MKLNGTALTMAAVIIVAGTVGSAFAYYAQFYDSIEEHPIDKDYLVIIPESNEWTGNVWNNTMTLDVSKCLHHTLYGTVKITDLTGVADDTLIKVTFAGSEGSSKSSSNSVEVTGFLYTVSGENPTISISATLPEGIDWPQDAQMTVTIMAVDA